MVKNPPVVWETWIPLLGWEDPLEKGTATHSSILFCVCARKQCLLFKVVYFLKKVAEEEIKMVDKEDAELTSHHEHIKNTPLCGATCPKDNVEADRGALQQPAV